MTDVLVIDLNEHWAECWVCGADTPYRWSLPIGECGELVSNGYEGDWGGVAACETCYQAHTEGLLTADTLAWWRRRRELEQRAMDHLIVRS